MYYLQNRYYDPIVKQMLSADDESLTTGAMLNNNNLFSYCDNNPVNRADNGGEVWNVVAGAIIGAGVSVGIEFLGECIAGEKISSRSLLLAAGRGAIEGGLAGAGFKPPSVKTFEKAFNVACAAMDVVSEYQNQKEICKYNIQHGEKPEHAMRKAVASGVANLAFSAAVDHYTPKTAHAHTRKRTSVKPKNVKINQTSRGHKKVIHVSLKKCREKFKKAFVRQIKKHYVQKLFQFNFKAGKWFYDKIRARGRKR